MSDKVPQALDLLLSLTRAHTTLPSRSSHNDLILGALRLSHELYQLLLGSNVTSLGRSSQSTQFNLRHYLITLATSFLL